jgi:predicted Zn-dependent peptidase
MTTQSVHKKSILESGIRVVTKNIPHARTISMGVWINVGARDELPEQHGLSHFIEHMIFKGTATRSAYQIAKEFDAIGGQANAMTSLEYTCFYARCYHTHLERIIDILSDMLLSSSFDTDEIVREKQVICQEMRMFEDDPEDYVNYLSGQAFWGNHPISRSILGTKQLIESFDTKMIRSYFHQHYSPQKIVIALAGNVEHESIVDRFEKVFTNFMASEYPLHRTPPQAEPKKIIEYRDLEMVHLCLAGKGFHLDAPQRYVFTLLNIILGGNMSSILFQEIREKNGLAYQVFSTPTMLTDTGMQSIYMGVEPSKVNNALDVVHETLDHLIQNPVSESRLSEAKEYTKSTIQLSEESVNNQMVRLGQSELIYHRYIRIKEIIENIEKITPDDIQVMAAEVLDMDQMAVALLGPVKE